MLAFCGHGGGSGGTKRREPVGRKEVSAERSEGEDKLDPDKGTIFGSIYF
jgi:hypothetical protein